MLLVPPPGRSSHLWLLLQELLGGAGQGGEGAEGGEGGPAAARCVVGNAAVGLEPPVRSQYWRGREPGSCRPHATSVAGWRAGLCPGGGGLTTVLHAAACSLVESTATRPLEYSQHHLHKTTGLYSVCNPQRMNLHNMQGADPPPSVRTATVGEKCSGGETAEH